LEKALPPGRLNNQVRASESTIVEVAASMVSQISFGQPSLNLAYCVHDFSRLP